uniref:LOC785621 protein n=1 Tax=Bos taurus TaxID=9913 RepID=A5PJZ0_BOVIN|nr:LOC785621 protein [Bos taurus]AAI42392.1 LOC785621 protein [Bos taurus]
MDKSLSLLILWLQLDWVSTKQDVSQSPEALNVREGDSVVLNCSYTDSALYFLQWFWQDPGKGLTSLLSIQANQKEQASGRITVSLDKSSRHSALYIATSQHSDSTTYLCAVRNNYGQGLIFSGGTRLSVQPQVKDPNPTVYQLRSPQSSDTSVCLFTDFDSNQVNMEKIMGSEGSTVHKTNSTVLNMEILGSKSNGIVTWGNTSDAGCEYTFNETIPFASSLEISCNAKLVEKSFETDINLNSQNLSVIVFRILLLKVVGFNLLMTLRLWSS